MWMSLTLPAFALWACCILGGSVVSATKCHADNCLRALFPTPSPSAFSSNAAFCSTFTATLDTRSTNFPTRASSACGTNPARYSSACSCKPTLSSTLSPTLSPTCTPTPLANIVKNGGFECGLAPWTAADVVNTAHKIGSPGDASPSAYEFNQVGPIDPDMYMHPASVNQGLTGLVAGAAYVLKFRTYFDKCTPSEGFVGVMLNHEPVYTVDACDHGAGAFTDNTVSFTAAAAAANLRFEFIIGENPAVVKIDNVVVVRA